MKFGCKILWVLPFLLISVYGKENADSTGSGDYVVVLHGMGRTPGSMKKLCRHLEKEGYLTINVDYPSMSEDVPEIVENYLGRVIREQCTDPEKKINFVTHSLGGIVVRAYLAQCRPPNLGRVVMLAPPNRGSELTDWLGDLKLYKWLLGPSGQQLGTDSASLPQALGGVDFELGVIAGDRTMNPWFSKKIPGPDDGKVSVQSTMVEGMKEHLVVHHSHAFIMKNRKVINQVIYFLNHGKFER